MTIKQLRQQIKQLRQQLDALPVDSPDFVETWNAIGALSVEIGRMKRG